MPRRQPIPVARSAWLAAVGAVATALSFAASVFALQDSSQRPSAEADHALERFLEDHSLLDLLAAELTARLPRVSADSRADIVEKLADLYSQLLDREQPASVRADIERRARQFAESAPAAEAFEIRLRLDRAAYTHAERLAERWRVRLADAAQKDESVRIFTEVGRDLDDIADRSGHMVDEFERQEQAGRDADSELLADHLAAARRRRSLANHLAGWSKAYAAEATDDPRLADLALRNFGALLNAPLGKPADIARVTAGTLHFEHVARAGVGAAVCEAVRGDGRAAIAWLNLVEGAEDVPPAVSAELPARRMTILARLQDWAGLTALVDARRRAAPLSAAESRLLAVLVCEAEPAKDADRALIRPLAESALADLASAGELSQVVDLSARYNLAPAGAQGFLANYIRGLRTYDQTREAHRKAGEDAEAPTGRADLARQYRDAAESLRRALSAKDASRFAGAEPATTMLVGLSLYYASTASGDSSASPSARLTESADWMRKASGLAKDAKSAAEALAGAVRALDLAAASSGPAQGDIRAKRDEAISEFLTRFPTNERAGAMMLKQATGGSMAPEQAAALLLRVPEGSPAYPSARRHAARLLYEIYRSATTEQSWHAQRYAAVAEPLLLEDHRAGLAGDRSAAARAVGEARRLLDALLSAANPDVPGVERALDSIDSLAHAGFADEPPLHDELEYRRAQVALARHDVAAAERIVNALLGGRAQASAGAPRGEFAAAARRLLLRHDVAVWRDAKRQGVSKEALADAARTVTRRGAQILLDAGADDASLKDPAALALLVGVAEAAADLWDTAGELDARSLSLRLHKRALAVQPANASLLRRFAELSEASGDAVTALDCWRTLSSGLEVGSPAWFEARWRLISLLAKTDPSRARESLAQHKALHPEFGPAPWGERLRALDAQLGSGGASGGSGGP